jgi:K+-transporting ATPase ATPase C chain
VPAAQVPPDAVTSSASGLDPDISPAYAAIQVGRVASARDLPVATVRALVAKYTRGRDAWIFGEPAVDVLQLNLALDSLEQG